MNRNIGLLGTAIFIFSSFSIQQQLQAQEVNITTEPVWQSLVSGYTKSVAWGDYDGDGDLDLACGNMYGKLRLYRNDNGNMIPFPVWESYENSYSIAWGDYDRDGDLDLVSGNDNDSNTLYRNDAGTLTSSPVWQSGPEYRTMSVCWGDYDGDGDLDLACGNLNRFGDEPHVTIYRNSGGTLSADPVWQGSRYYRTRSVSWGDYDGDGDLDLACGNGDYADIPGGGGQCNVIYRNYGGMFTGGLVSLSKNLTLSVAWGDYDGDGDLDLACGNYMGQKSTIYRNDGGIFERYPVWLSSDTASAYSVAWGDYDLDGDLDLFCGRYLYRNDGDTLTTEPVWGPINYAYAQSAAWGDYDGDGDLDIAIGKNGYNAIYRNEGIYFSHASWGTNPGYSVSSYAWGDYDGDGDYDLACGTWRDQPNIIYRNDGDSLNADPVWISNPQNYTQCISWGDYDGDGDLDLACGNGGYYYNGPPQPNTIYRNDNGILTADPVWISSDTLDTEAIAWGDYDGDGDLDLACGNDWIWPIPQNVVYENDGAFLSYDPIWRSNPNYRTNSVSWADFDGDNDLDLACGNSGPNTIYRSDWGTLTSDPVWSVNPAYLNDTHSIAWGDYDGDGDLDLACGNSVSQPTIVYQNTGDSLGSEPAWISSDYGPSLLCWVDYDNDGDLDLASYYGPHRGIYRNDGGTLDSDRISSQSSSIAMRAGKPLGIVEVPLLDIGGKLKSGQATTLTRVSETPWIDFNGDGDIDAADYNGIKVNKTNDTCSALPNRFSYMRNVDFSSSSSPNEFVISYVLVDTESDKCRIIPEYSPNGGGNWKQAVEGTGSDGTTGLVSSPGGVPHMFVWDANTIEGTGYNVLFRIRVYSNPDFTGLVQRFFTYQRRLRYLPLARPHFITSSRSFDFPTTTVGDTAWVTLALTNLGDADLEISDVSFSSAAFSWTGPSGIALHRADSLTTTILFTPDGAGEFSGTMDIASNDPLSPVTSIDLHGLSRGLEFTAANFYPSGEISQGMELNISITMKDSVRVDSAHVYFKRGGSLEYDVFKMSRIYDPVNEQYFASIPPDSVGAAGVEYFVRVFNGVESALGSLVRLRVRVANLEFPFIQPQGRYRMISVPLDMEGTILGALTDDLGGEDKTKWRMFAYDPGMLYYLELPNDSVFAFEQGRSYWLVAKDAVKLDTGPAEGLSTATDSSFSLMLEPGWNMVGDPFDFAVAWDSFFVDTLAGDLLSMAVAESTVVEPAVGWVAGTGYQFDVGILEPFEGYWVRSLSDSSIVLKIPPREAVIGTTGAAPGIFASSTKDAAGRGIGSSSRDVAIVSEGALLRGSRELVLATKDATGDDGWRISVGASCSGAADLSNFVGVMPGATNHWDSHDRSEPPLSPGKAISLYFPHVSWGKRAGFYAMDIRGDYGLVDPMELGLTLVGAGGDHHGPDGRNLQAALMDQELWGHVWCFDVAKNFLKEGAGDEVVLDFSGLESLPVGAKAYLIDRRLEKFTDIGNERSYRFFLAKRDLVPNEQNTRFLLLVGSEEFIDTQKDQLPKLPAKTVLHQNYPNPFNPSTIIGYDIAKAGRVSIKIYSTTGALVKVLYSGRRNPGRYEVGWNGENERGERVASGIYFCRLSAGKISMSRKLVLLK